MFGFGKKKEESERDKQLKALRLAYPTVRRPHNDDSILEVLFLVQKEYNTLKIFLLSDFPNDAPSMSYKYTYYSHIRLTNRVLYIRFSSCWAVESFMAR